ncbi:mCG57369, partial [Mus musculus]
PLPGDDPGRGVFGLQSPGPGSQARGGRRAGTGVVLARPPTTWAPASSFVPAPRRWAHNSGCFPSAAPGASTSLQLSAGQVLGDGGPFSAAGGARSYGMWSFQIRECPCPPHCKGG